MQGQGCNSQSIKNYMHVYMWTRSRSTVSHHVLSEREGRKLSQYRTWENCSLPLACSVTVFSYSFHARSNSCQAKPDEVGNTYVNPAGKSDKMGKKGERKDV